VFGIRDAIKIADVAGGGPGGLVWFGIGFVSWMRLFV
jgi:hypothetical protein